MCSIIYIVTNKKKKKKIQLEVNILNLNSQGVTGS